MEPGKGGGRDLEGAVIGGKVRGRVGEGLKEQAGKRSEYGVFGGSGA